MHFLQLHFAQGVSTTATATATIVTPLAIARNADLSFGDLAVNATPGTVALTAAAAPVRTPLGGVSLVTGATAITAARFTVTGASGAAYTIALPANGVVTLTGAGTPIPANGFSTDVATPVLTGGTQIVLCRSNT